MVKAVREAFDARIPELKAALFRNLGGEEVLPVHRVVLNSIRPLPPEAVAMLSRVLPEGRPVHREDAIVAIQQLLMHGWAKQARGKVVEQDGQVVLRLDITPFARITALVLEAPVRWKSIMNEDFRARFPVGEPFNPEAFGLFLDNWVRRFMVEGTPLVDMRGSAFVDATGILRLTVKEPLIRRITVKVDQHPFEAEYIKASLGPLLGQPMRTTQLRQFIGMLEHRLHLQELRYQLRPVRQDDAECAGENIELFLTPVHHQAQSLDLSLGYETTLGGEIGFTYRTLNFGGSGVEGEVSGARDRLEDRAFLALRGPMSSSLPGAGLELWASSYRQRLDAPMSFAAPEIKDWADGRIDKDDVGLGFFARYGNLGQGKARLEVTWREAAFLSDGDRSLRHEHTAEASTEWDNFDRHTFPGEGLLLRGRYGAGTSLAGLDPAGAFQFGYLRARGLTTFGANSDANIGLDLDLEWGNGEHLPLDRWWTLGGTSFLMGTQSLAYLSPNFLVARLGIPLRMAGPFGTSLQVIPRVDLGSLAGPGEDLFRSGRSLGTGLLIRTILSKFYVEVSYGFLRPYGPGVGWGPATGSFGAIIGTQPFDLWQRR